MPLEPPRAGRGRDISRVELLVEREACQSRLIKEADDVGISWVARRSRYFSETPVVVDGRLPEIGAFREGSVGKAYEM